MEKQGQEAQYIDIHAHVNFSAFDADREAVVKRSLNVGTWIINVGTQKDTSQSAVDLANKYESGVYAAVGLHPVHTSKSFHDKKELGEGGKDFTSRGEQFDYDFYKKLGQNKKVVAIGECGLDYYRLEDDTIKIQKENFIKQITLASELGKPLMLHIRNAYEDSLEILKEQVKTKKIKGNVHFFAGSVEIAQKFLDLGFTLSFTGVITFTRDYDEVVKYIPLEMIMSETDCPYISPIPYRGKRNEPVYVQEVVKKIATIKNMDLELVRNQLLENAKRSFNFL
jgi:TatD DNase family protein